MVALPLARSRIPPATQAIFVGRSMAPRETVNYASVETLQCLALGNIEGVGEIKLTISLIKLLVTLIDDLQNINKPISGLLDC